VRPARGSARCRFRKTGSGGHETTNTDEIPDFPSPDGRGGGALRARVRVGDDARERRTPANTGEDDKGQDLLERAGRARRDDVQQDLRAENWKDHALGEIFTTILTTMPNDGSVVLTENDTVDLVAHLLQANGYPEGPDALKYDAAAKEIKVVAVK
jgi:hypothetical protein